MSAERYVLVTGGAGFVGTNLAARLAAEGHRVLVLDNLSRWGVERNLAWLERSSNGRARTLIGEVADEDAVRQAVSGAKAVFHLAAQVAVTTSLDDPLEDFRVNLRGTLLLLEELRRLRRPVPLLFTSTNKVYGGLSSVQLERSGERWEPTDPRLRERGVSEEWPLDFCTPYGCSKGAADQYVLDYAHMFGLPAVVFRMSCIYGEHQHGTEDQGWVAHFLLRALAREPITIFGDGAQVRDVLAVSDLVEAMMEVHEDAERLAGTAFNVGGGPENALSLLQVLDLIEQVDERRPEVAVADERAGDQRWYVSDTSRLRHETGWRPRVAVRDGIGSLYAWLLTTRAAAPAPVRAR
jgi:CDP-paratose 2-epimerase